MAAGLGFKDFVTGEVLTAADVDGYLMQGTWVFANAAARTAAVTSPQEGNMSYLKDTNSVEFYTGAAWSAVGGSGGMTLINAGGTTLSGNTTVSSIPATYKHLFIVVKNAEANASGANLSLRMNGDSGATSYEFAKVRAINTTLAGEGIASSSIQIGNRLRDTAGFSAGLCSQTWVYNYTDTDYVWTSSVSIASDGGTPVFVSSTGKYDCSAAISSITIVCTDTLDGGTVFVYGVN